MTQSQNRGSIISAMFWMFFLSILLFWLPVVGPLIAGYVGGKKAGGVGAAIAAVFLPGIILGLCLFLLTTILAAMPVVGVFAGFGAFAFSLAHVGPLLIGAIVGGAMA